ELGVADHEVRRTVQCRGPCHREVRELRPVSTTHCDPPSPSGPDVRLTARDETGTPKGSSRPGSRTRASHDRRAARGPDIRASRVGPWPGSAREWPWATVRHIRWSTWSGAPG